MNLKELYQEIILDHGKNPRNLRKTDNFTKDAKGHNPLCGDKVHIFLKLGDDKKIEDHNFNNLKLMEISPFASDFYYITRLIYARYAKEFLNKKTSYDHPLEKIAISMSNNTHTKKFSQIQTYLFKKK